MTKRILTEAEKEARYDAERSGSAWQPIIDLITSDPWEPILAITDDPTNDGKPSALLAAAEYNDDRAIAAWIDAHAARIEPAEDSLAALLEQIEQHFGRTPATPIRVERVYHDTDRNGDITDKPIGPLAYTSYVLGDGDTRRDLASG
jgi:hypothetical protein